MDDRRPDPRNGRMKWVRLFVRETNGRVAGLSAAATGAYFRLLFAYLDHQKPLQDDGRFLARIAGVSAAEWKAIREEFDFHGTFEQRDGFLYDSLAEERIAEFRKRSRANKSNAESRWSVMSGLEDAQ